MDQMTISSGSEGNDNKKERTEQLVIIVTAFLAALLFANSLAARSNISTPRTIELTPNSSSVILNLSNATGEMVVPANRTVLLKYFWSKSCSICRRQDPYLVEFVEEHPSLIFDFIDANKDEAMEQMITYDVYGTPTFVLITGTIAKVWSGFTTKEKLESLICPALQDEMCLTGKTSEKADITKWW